MVIRFNQPGSMHQYNLDLVRHIEFTWQGTSISKATLHFAPNDICVLTGSGAQIVYDATTRKFLNGDPKVESIFLNPGRED